MHLGHQAQLLVHVLHQTDHLVRLPVPDVKGWLLQVLLRLRGENVLGIGRHASLRGVFGEHGAGALPVSKEERGGGGVTGEGGGGRGRGRVRCRVHSLLGRHGSSQLPHVLTFAPVLLSSLHPLCWKEEGGKVWCEGRGGGEWCEGGGGGVV